MAWRRIETRKIDLFAEYLTTVFEIHPDVSDLTEEIIK